MCSQWLQALIRPGKSLEVHQFRVQGRADDVHLFLGHHSGERERESALSQVLSDRKIALAITKALLHVRLQMDRQEVGAHRHPARFQPLGQFVAVYFCIEAHHVDEPGHTRGKRLDDWDFDWQGFYYFKDPVPLPPLTRVELTAVYDNSEANPRNPNSPPKAVRWGEQTTDEMCLAVIGFILE